MMTMSKLSTPESDSGIKKAPSPKLKFPVILNKNQAASELSQALAKREKVLSD